MPGLTTILALLMEVDAHALGQGLPEWLDLISTVLPAEASFLTDMGRSVDPAGSGLLEENLGLLPGESVARRVFVNYLWEMAPLIRTGSAP